MASRLSNDAVNERSLSGSPTAGAIAFRTFRLDLIGGRLLRGARAIALRPKTWAVLVYLAERPGRRKRFDSREEMLAALSLLLAAIDEQQRNES